MQAMMLVLVLSPVLAFYGGARLPAMRRQAVAPAMAMRTSVIGGNWKMNPTSLEEAISLANAVSKEYDGSKGEAVIFPPFPFLGPVKETIDGSSIHLGAQSIFFEDKGAYTGAVAASMVKSMGCTHVLAGHSERRSIFKDDDMAINRKVLKILEAGMIPVLCIGETKEEYDAKLVESVCAIQLAKDLAGVTAEQMKTIVIAYEPVWAIGTGLVCPADVAQSTHAYIRKKLGDMYSPEVAEEVRIQYGGSVTPDSVDELMSMPDIDGCLVGGASLLADSFVRILNYEEEA
ncbi:hypothetical protein CTAYLR_002821 [Chrysophaeum taylorii]|uniref:Triosephosphate isomerase n=1 Tax=Chrysophaeum taylorii TaxID=2483200 RepID=A0AAD7U9P5_9STRA|nr:hypothetical protein CTAYLR_002821 [Chrysophaeum taylorii]